jgi:hypothetical protein
VTRKRVALKHEIESGVDLFFRDFPGHQRAIREICREQCLTHPPNRPGAQHRRDPRHHNIGVDATALRDFLKWLVNEPFDFVLRNGENLFVNRIVVLDREHAA